MSTPRVSLESLRSTASAAAEDVSNPLTVERTASATTTPGARRRLYDEAVNAGFREFRGVGLSSTTRLTLGSVPDCLCAESLEITGRVVVYCSVSLTAAGVAARVAS